MGLSPHPGQACAKNILPDDPVPGTPWRWWHSRTLNSSGTHSSCLQLASPCLYIGTFPGSWLCSSYSSQVVPTCLWGAIPRPLSTKPGIQIVFSPGTFRTFPFFPAFVGVFGFFIVEVANMTFAFSSLLFNGRNWSCSYSRHHLSGWWGIHGIPQQIH